MMDQIKKGSKTLLYIFFQASSAEECKSNKGLDSPTPGPSMDDPSYATLSSKISESQYICSEENRQTTVPHQNDSSDKKNREKMTFNLQWTEKYNLVAQQREVWYHEMLIVFQ